MKRYKEANKKDGLFKTKGIAKDTQGMEFSYTKLVQRESDYDDNMNWVTDETVVYIDDIFKLQADTLKELKKMVGRK